jgi:hypothetical protein
VEESLHSLKKVLKVDNIEGGYKRKKNNFQNFNTRTPSSQIADINLNSYFSTKKPETQNNPINNQTKNQPIKNCQRT